MSKSRRREPAKKVREVRLTPEQLAEMRHRAVAFGVAATQLRDLEADPSTPAGYGIFNTICVNTGYAMELYLKLLCHIHNGRFAKTHELAALHDALPEEVQSGLQETFLGNLDKFGMKIRTVRPFQLTANEPSTAGFISVSFAVYMHEFDRTGMTDRRYPEDGPDKIELDLVHPALCCALTLEAAAHHFANGS